MTWQISKDFHFSASHVLGNLPEGHPCGRLHGHNYQVRVKLSGSVLDKAGFILDYGQLKPFGNYLDTVLDHRHLNTVVDCQPSAENLAKHLHEILFEIVDIPAGIQAAVGVSETPKTWAWFKP